MATVESPSSDVNSQSFGVRLIEALENWSRAIGEANVDFSREARERYGTSTSPWSNEPVAILRPCKLSEVQEIVRIAGYHRIPIYPISGGKNWGLGDACPTTAGQVIVDLRRMNAIREVNSELAYVVVEAGVTQGQLYEFLKVSAPDLALDVTGAGPTASIVGNIMERGFGHSPYGDRYHNSCNYEVVLANGRLIRTGFGNIQNASTANLLKAGLGPSLDGLFTQSNFGIVTALTVWLLPRPKYLEAFAFKVEDEAALPAIVDALRPLRLNGVLASTVHIANDLRVISAKSTYPWEAAAGKTPLPDSIRDQLRRQNGVGAWNVLGGLSNCASLARAARSELRRSLRGIAKPRFISSGRLKLASCVANQLHRFGIGGRLHSQLDSIRSAYDLLQGVPVSEPLKGPMWRNRAPRNANKTDPTTRGDGLIWLSPTLPMTGRDANRVNEIAIRTLDKFGFEPLLTFVAISGRAMCAPISICYEKERADERERATECYKQLFESCLDAGYPPYRMGIQSMSSGSLVTPGPPAAELLSELATDSGILAPGRYE